MLASLLELACDIANNIMGGNITIILNDLYRGWQFDKTLDHPLQNIIKNNNKILFTLQKQCLARKHFSKHISAITL